MQISKIARPGHDTDLSAIKKKQFVAEQQQ